MINLKQSVILKGTIASIIVGLSKISEDPLKDMFDFLFLILLIIYVLILLIILLYKELF